MKQLNYNQKSKTSRRIYLNERINNYKNKKQAQVNAYSKYSTQENDLNLNEPNIFNSNNNIRSEANYREYKNSKENNILSNNFSNSLKIATTQRKHSNKINENILSEQYALKDNLQSKNYLSYLRNQRNTYNFKDKEQDNNKIDLEIKQLKTNEIREHSSYNHNNFNKRIKNKNNNSSYEKDLLLNKLYSSKSSNDFFIGDKHDILIEYNNAPIINSKRYNNDFINSITNGSMGNMLQNSYMKNYKEDSLMALKKENPKKNHNNFELYNSHNIGNNEKLYDKKYFDIDLSNINNFDNISKENNYKYLINEKKKKLLGQSYIDNYKNDNIELYEYNPSLDKYKKNSKNNTQEYGHSINKYNANKNISHIFKNNQYSITIAKRRNQEVSKTQNNIDNANNKLLANYKSTKMNNRNNHIMKNIVSTKNDINSSTTRTKLKNIEQSIKDILCNKKSIPQQQKSKNKSPINIEELNTNAFNSKGNKRLTSTNYKNNIKTNINGNIIDKLKSDEKYKVQCLTSSYNEKKTKNKKAISNRQKILSLRRNNKNSFLDSLNNTDTENNELSNILSNLNNTNGDYIYLEKKSNLNNCFNSQENIKYIKSKTNRCNKPKIINQNIIITKDSHLNKYEYKLSKDIKKADNKALKDTLSKRKVNNSPLLNDIPQYKSNYSKNNNYNNSCNSKNVYTYRPNQMPSLLSNKKEKNKKIIYKTEYNTNNDFLKTDNKKIINSNNNEDSGTILKSINCNNQLNSNPIKLYLKKMELQNIEDNDISKENKDNKDKNGNNTIYINNYLKQITILNKNISKDNIVKKYNSITDNKKSSPNITLNNRHSIININNNKASNANTLNLKNTKINLCEEKNEKFNILSPINCTKNITSPNQKEKKNYKNNIINVKNVASEIFDKNKNIKNINRIKPSINKSKDKTNYINSENGPSYLKITTNTIKYNNDNINKNDIDSSKNILVKSNNNESNSNLRKTNIVNKRQQLMINNSEGCIFNSHKFNTKNNIELKNRANNNNYDNNSIKYIKYNNVKNNNLYNDNRRLIKTLKSPKLDMNIINYYKNINLPLVSKDTSIQLHNCNNINHSPTGVYLKPSCVTSMSKSKKKVIKSKSENKTEINESNNINQNTDKNINKKTSKNIYENSLISSLKKSKISKSLNSEIYFNTSPSFYQKEEYFKNNIRPKRDSSSSVNSSIFTKNWSSYTINENESRKSFNNYLNLKCNKYKKNIREPITKTYCYLYKFCNYFIKPPIKGKCYIIKKVIKHKKNKSNKIIRDRNNISDNYQKLSFGPEIFTYNNEDEKNNDNSQNGLVMTFGDVKKNTERSYALMSGGVKKDNICIGNIIDNIIEDSDLDIYKNLQQISSQSTNKNDKISNHHSSSNIINSENEDLKIYESLEKDKSLNKYITRDYYKPTDGKEIKDEYEENKSKTFKKADRYNLENAKKGLIILDKLALRRGIKSNEESLNNISNSHTRDNENINKINENISLGTNKLKGLFKSKKEASNYYKRNKRNYLNQKNKIKYSYSVNRDIMKGISKIKNVLEKNNVNNFDISINDNKIYTYDGKKKINDSNYTDYEYKDNIDLSERTKSKARVFIHKSKTNLGSSIENNTIDSYLDFINGEENPKVMRYRESEIYSNKNKTSIRSSNSNETSDNIQIKCNLLNEELYNHSNDLYSYSEEELNNYYNSKINIEEFEKYLKEIKKEQSNNSIKHDIIYLLNILVETNYSNITNQITKIILYKNNDILNDSKEIVEREHLFKDIIFNAVFKDIKYIYLYAKLCYDLTNNILNALNEQKNMKNNKERNLKLIINDEFMSILNSFKNIKIGKINNKESDEYYYLRKKILGYMIFVYELINYEILKQQFGLFILEQFYKIYKDFNFNNTIKNLYLESIIILLNKLGKLVFEKNNIKLIQNINNYINNSIFSIINNENKSSIPSCLVYKIMNLITRRDNQWKDSLLEKIENEEKMINTLLDIKIEEKKVANNNRAVEFWNKEINIDDVNKSIIEEDLVNYITYYTEENSKGQINIKNNIDKSYNWKIIEDLVNDKNFGLSSIINYFISVSTNVIHDDNQILIANDYIKNIIEYYANNLSKSAIELIQNEMIKTFLRIDEFINKNKNMYKILGNLLFILIDNKLCQIKFFNHYLKMEKQTQINMATITRYCIISSGKFAKKYFNDFKQTKLFNNNDIFTQYVKDPLKDLFYFIQ